MTQYQHLHKHEIYVNGTWTASSADEDVEVHNAATTEVIGAAAGWAATSVSDRMALMRDVLAGYESRRLELAAAVTAEVGAPAFLAAGAQTEAGIGHLIDTMRALSEFEFTLEQGSTRTSANPSGSAA